MLHARAFGAAEENLVPPPEALVVSVNSLHVTNGDSVLYTWRKAGLLGTHLAWKDALNEGPVPGGLTLEALSRVRAGYLTERGYGNPIKLHRDFEKRDAAIARAAEFEEVVLWFEHDLYDQLQLLQILAVLEEGGTGAGHAQLIQSENYLGTLSTDEMMALYPKRRFVTRSIAQGAAQAWAAVCSPDPGALESAAKQHYMGLPFLHDALVRLCEEYPSLENGLSRSQKQVLEAVARGARTGEEVFRGSQSREEAAFLGDAGCEAIVRDLLAQPAPLLCVLDHGIDLTVLGRRVLAAEADWLDHQPVDRWIGGVHIRAEEPWRWDERASGFVRRRPE